MRIPDKCSCGGRCLVYCSVRNASFLVRYRRCDRCHELSKSIVLKTFLSGNESIDHERIDATIKKVLDTRHTEQGNAHGNF